MKRMIAFTSALLCLVAMHAYADAPAGGSSSSAGSRSKPAVKSQRATAERNKTTSTNQEPAVNVGKTANPNHDRLDLDTTTVTGNRELPKVLYIVPWKKADVGNLPGQPFNTLLDEALTPVDREVFRRQVEYYQAISNKDQPGKGYAGAKSAPPAESK